MGGPDTHRESIKIGALTMRKSRTTGGIVLGLLALLAQFRP